MSHFNKSNEEIKLSLLVAWERVCVMSFQITQRMPKRVRFSFVARIDGATLDLNTYLLQARFERGRRCVEMLKKADLQLSLLRSLARLSFVLELISSRDFERLSNEYNQVGAMLGGWIKSVK